MAALVVIGIALPPLGAVMKPYLTASVVGLLCVAFLRIDILAFRAYVRRPGIVLCASAWTSFAIPALIAAGAIALGAESAVPALFLGLMLQAVAPPIMATPAFAALMGLDATLILTTLIVSTAIAPISAPLFVWLLGLDLSLPPLALGLKLYGILAGSALVGLVLRRIVGLAAIMRHRDEIDGINILLLFVFVSAVMGEFGVEFIRRPLLVCGLIVLVFAVFTLLLTLTYLVFAAAGRKRAFALGVMTSQRNMGLMIAGTGGILPDLTWLFFAASQFPIYLSPILLQPFAKWIEKRELTVKTRA